MYLVGQPPAAMKIQPYPRMRMSGTILLLLSHALLPSTATDGAGPPLPGCYCACFGFNATGASPKVPPYACATTTVRRLLRLPSRQLGRWLLWAPTVGSRSLLQLRLPSAGRRGHLLPPTPNGIG